MRGLRPIEGGELAPPPSAITLVTSLWKNVVSQALDCNLLQDARPVESSSQRQPQQWLSVEVCVLATCFHALGTISQ